MPTPQEYFVMVVKGAAPHARVWIMGPFRDSGLHKGETARVVATTYAMKNHGTVLGPFDPKKRPAKRRAMDEDARTPNNPGMIDHMLRELEHPAEMLTRWELDFLHSAKDQFDRRGSLSPRQFEVLERIYAERTA